MSCGFVYKLGYLINRFWRETTQTVVGCTYQVIIKHKQLWFIWFRSVVWSCDNFQNRIHFFHSASNKRGENEQTYNNAAEVDKEEINKTFACLQHLHELNKVFILLCSLFIFCIAMFEWYKQTFCKVNNSKHIKLFFRDKKKEEKEEEEVEEEKPRVRKTSFMRSVLRNFSMELMAKTMQYGWADLGQCRYLRNRGGDDDQDGSGAHTLAKDTMKVSKIFLIHHNLITM